MVVGRAEIARYQPKDNTPDQIATKARRSIQSPTFGGDEDHTDVGRN